MRFPALACLLAAAALAGCLGGEGGGGAPAAAGPSSTGLPVNLTPPPPPPIPSLDLFDCSQFHTFFPFPASAFGVSVPDGFTLVTTDPAGQMTQVFVNIGSCAGGLVTAADLQSAWAPASEMQLTLPVAVPDPLADPAVTLDLIPLVGYTDNDAALGLLLGWTNGGNWAAGTFTFADPTAAGTFVHESATIATTNVTYDVATEVNAAPGGFEAVYRIWMPDGMGGVAGHLRVDTTGAESLGEGTALFSATNLEGGPPLWAGTSHRVDHALVHWAWVPMAPVAPAPPAQG